MKAHNLFYIVGVFFIILSFWYFAGEFLSDLPDMIKLFLLVLAVIASFVVGDVLRGANR